MNDSYPANTEGHSASAFKRPRVLLVEDDFLIRLTLAEILGDEGYEVLEAATGDEALAALAGQDGFQAILTDVNIPGSINGTGVGKFARSRFPDLPIIYMTGRADLLQHLAPSMRDRVVAKPYLPSEIAAVLREVVR